MLDMSMWTTVPISNDLATAAISLSIQIDHPLLGFFDADVSLGDLLVGRPRYCSKLLVSALLFWALLSHLLKLVDCQTNNHRSICLSRLTKTNGLGVCGIVAVASVSASGTNSEILTHYQRFQRYCF